MAELNPDLMTNVASHLKARQITYLIKKMNTGKDLTVTEQKRLNQLIAEGERGKSDDMGGTFISGAEVARHYGLTPPTISDHVKKGNIVPNDDGTFDKANTDAYFCGKLGRDRRPINEPEVKTYTESKLNEFSLKIEKEKYRKIKAEADSKELFAAQLRESLVSYDDVVRCWAGRAQMVRDSLLYLVDRLPPMLATRTQNEIRDILLAEIESILQAYSRHGKFTPKQTDAA